VQTIFQRRKQKKKFREEFQVRPVQGSLRKKKRGKENHWTVGRGKGTSIKRRLFLLEQADSDCKGIDARPACQGSQECQAASHRRKTSRFDWSREINH